jgi:predicted secreted protein
MEHIQHMVPGSSDQQHSSETQAERKSTWTHRVTLEGKENIEGLYLLFCFAW